MFNRKLEPLSISHEFAPALEMLHALPWEWSDAEALERRHKIGQGSLILLDALIAGGYATRRAIINSAASANSIHEHIHADEPIDCDRVYLPLTLHSSLGRTSELLFWQMLQRRQCKTRLRRQVRLGILGKASSPSATTASIHGNTATPNWISSSG